MVRRRERHDLSASDTAPMRVRVPRPSLAPPVEGAPDAAGAMTHDELVDALRAVDGLVDVGHDPPNFHFRGRPFLHFHLDAEEAYADVRFGADFEPVRASTPRERLELLARVYEHTERVGGTRKSRRREKSDDDS